MELDLRTLEPRHAHDLITGSILPRPIAWVSTVSAAGRVNLAPFSFFTGVSWNPPALAFSVANREDGTKKDTLRNIEETSEFVVHMVSTSLIGAMEASAGPIPYGEDADYVHGITLLPSKTVRPPTIQEAQISFECVLDRIASLGEGAGAGNLVIGRIQLFRAKDEIIQHGREVDWRGLDPLGRLSGNKYCAIHSVIESETH